MVVHLLLALGLIVGAGLSTALVVAAGLVLMTGLERPLGRRA